MPHCVGVSPWSLSMCPRSCNSAAVISEASAPADSANAAVCNACSSWVTGSPEYMRPPLASNSAQMSGMVNAMIARRGSPRQGIGLHIGEALHRFLHAFLVAQARILDAAERREFQAITGHLAHVDATDDEFADKARDPVQAIGADGGGQPVVGRVGDRNRVVDGLEANDRRNGTEGFVFYDRHVGRDVIEHRGRVQGSLADIPI